MHCNLNAQLRANLIDQYSDSESDEGTQIFNILSFQLYKSVTGTSKTRWIRTFQPWTFRQKFILDQCIF